MVTENSESATSEFNQFRAMNSPRKNETGESGGTLCQAFQPLYKRLAGNNLEEGQRSEKCEEAVLAQARQKGWQEGVERGQNEACRIAKEALAPVLHSFLNNWFALVQSSERNEASAAENIVSLSFAIVRKILGQDATLSPKDNTPIETVLTQSLASANKLVLKINPQDLEHIQDLLQLEKLTYPDRGSVILQPDENVSPGELAIAGDAVADREKRNRHIIHQVMALLAEQALIPA